jgi:hypothetical protein
MLLNLVAYLQHTTTKIEVKTMAKKTPMTPEAARRIQSAVDSGRAKTSDEGFKARAMSAASKNTGNKK